MHAGININMQYGTNNIMNTSNKKLTNAIVINLLKAVYKLCIVQKI